MNLPFFAEEAPASPTRQAEAAYPERPGYRRRDTSKEAADAIGPRAVILRDLVLAEIQRKPGPADEIATRLRQTVLAVRPRTTELAKLGKIIDSNERRANASGRKAIVWSALP